MDYNKIVDIESLVKTCIYDLKEGDERPLVDEFGMRFGFIMTFCTDDESISFVNLDNHRNEPVCLNGKMWPTIIDFTYKEGNFVLLNAKWIKDGCEVEVPNDFMDQDKHSQRMTWELL